MKVQKLEASKEKKRLREEIQSCAYCAREKRLGFSKCDYHKNVIEYLMNNIEVAE